jgi:sporulation protein YlmC with PRC-barrel domain
MPISVKDVDDMFNKDVFTAKGMYCGKVSDLEFDLGRFKIKSIVIQTAKGTFLGSMVGGKKGIIVPYQMVQAIGDVVLIKHIAIPTEDMSSTETSGESVELA